MRKSLPDRKTLMEMFSYDEDSGVLTRRAHGRLGRPCRAGSLTSRGYRRVPVGGARFLEHRIIFKMMTGSEPNLIDHINGVRSDNRWANLRASNEEENGRNRRPGRNNTSGAIGVYFSNHDGKWIAEIKVSYKKKNLGRFDCMEDAVQARRAAEQAAGYPSGVSR